MTPSHQCPNHQAAKPSQVQHFLSVLVYLEFLASQWFQHQHREQHILLYLSISSLVLQGHSGCSFPLSSSGMLTPVNLFSKWWQSALFSLH